MKLTDRLIRASIFALAISATLLVAVGVAAAPHDYRGHGRGHDRGPAPGHVPGRFPPGQWVRRDAPGHHARAPGHRRPHEVIVVPPRRHYPYYRHRRYSDDFLGIFAFTALTLAIINNLDDRQQRAYDQATYRAITAPVGETIRWNDGSASGSVTSLREGTSSTGRYCREFRQKVTIGGKREEMFGTACRNPDGSWEIVQ